MIKGFAVLKNYSHLLRNIDSICTVPVRVVPANFRRMAIDAKDLPTVDIDPSGVFKYILLKVYNSNQTCPDPIKILVRGYKRCEYHSDIYDEVQKAYQPLDLEPYGGGRISHDPDDKKIHIYGYSQGYGKADHEITAKLVKEAYPDYTISISDEGY